MSKPTTLLAFPEFWDVHPPTQAQLTSVLMGALQATTTPNALASLATAIAVVIADSKLPREAWGPLLYDLNLHIQTLLVQELMATQPAEDLPLTMPTRVPEPDPVPEPEPIADAPAPEVDTRNTTVPSNLSGGVGILPRS